MKSKIKRHSRSVLAVILTLSMLVSCMMVGLIATDAAKVTDSVAATDDSTVGDTTYYVVGDDFGNWNYNNTSYPMTNVTIGGESNWWTTTVNMIAGHFFKFTNGTTLYGPQSNTIVNTEGSDKSGKTANSSGAFQLGTGSASGQTVIWWNSNTGTLRLRSGELYLDGFINGSSVTGTSGNQFQPDPNDASLHYATLECTSADQYFAIYAKNAVSYYNYTYQELADGVWSNAYNNMNANMSGDGYKIRAANVSGSTITVKYNTYYKTMMWTATSVSSTYYLHYAENDNGMGSAAIQQMTDNGDGTYSYTVSDWDKTKMNMLVNKSSTNVTGTGDSTSLTVTASSLTRVTSLRRV